METHVPSGRQRERLRARVETFGQSDARDHRGHVEINRTSCVLTTCSTGPG